MTRRTAGLVLALIATLVLAVLLLDGPEHEKDWRRPDAEFSR